MVIVWGSVFVLLYLKADEITKDPCEICARVMGEDVKCTLTTGYVPVNRIYYSNGTIVDEDVKIFNVQPMEVPKLNLSLD